MKDDDEPGGSLNRIEKNKYNLKKETILYCLFLVCNYE